MYRQNSKIIKTDVSTFTWKIKDYGLAVKYSNGNIKSQENRVGNFLWLAEIVDEYNSRSGKGMRVYIIRDKSVPFSYEKFSYDLKIDYLMQTKETTYDDLNRQLRNFTKIDVGELIIDNYSMEFKFELKLYEHDLTGDDVKEMNTIERKMKIISDLGGLLDSGVCSNMDITVDNKTFQLHQAIMSRVPVMPSVIDLDPKLFEIFLRFVYTGEFGSVMNTEELQKMKAFADETDFVPLQNVCSKLLK